MSNALNICAAVALVAGSIGAAKPTVEPGHMAIRVDSGAIPDFSRFLAGIAPLSRKMPVILDLAGEQPPISPTVGTATSFGHAFPDEPLLFRISQHVIHIGTGPAHRTIKDEELPEYLKELVEAASKSKSVAVPILASDRAVMALA